MRANTCAHAQTQGHTYAYMVSVSVETTHQFKGTCLDCSRTLQQPCNLHTSRRRSAPRCLTQCEMQASRFLPSSCPVAYLPPPGDPPACGLRGVPAQGTGPCQPHGPRPQTAPRPAPGGWWRGIKIGQPRLDRAADSPFMSRLERS